MHYPGGVPAVRDVDVAVRSCSSLSLSDDAALCIHVARIALVDRLRRLERDADVAGRDAVKARSDGATNSKAYRR